MDCFTNYSYDVGGFPGGTNTNLYYNFYDRITTLDRKVYSTAILSVGNSTAYVNPSNQRELIIQWDIEFLKQFGNRNLRSYMRYVSSGDSGWQALGTHSISNPPLTHGKIQVASDQRHLVFEDGTPFSWIGI